MLARSLLLTAPHQLAWVDEPLDEPGPGTALVRSLAGAISIGSELPRYAGTARGWEPRYPCMTGYESLGVVEAVGPGVERLRVGDRVVAFYGHRTAALVSEQKALRVPDGVSDALALLAILTCDAAKGVRRLAPAPTEAALVTGAGAMGLLTLFILKAYGVAAVDVVDPDARRHPLAQALGARNVLRPEEVADGAEEYPIGIECSARDSAFALLQRRLSPQGRLCVLSDGNLETPTLTHDFHTKELCVVGSSDGWNYQEHAQWYFDEVRRRPTKVADVFQLEISAEASPATFAALAARDVTPVKVLVRYL